MSEAFGRAVARFAAIDREDPRLDEGLPASVGYHRRLAEWVDRVRPGAPESMRLAARCQHLRRWAIAREEYPAGRTGYRAWRAALASRTAEEAARILADVGYGDPVVARVRKLVSKEGLRTDADVQSFEDAICLAFLEHDLASFAEKHDDEKLRAILQKTWRKMTPRGQELAGGLVLSLPDRLRQMVADLA